MIPTPAKSIQQWSQIIAGLGSVVLSALLVVLYKRQQEQLAAQHEAVLEVTDVEWHGDKAILWVSNYGNGVAKNLALTTLVKVDTDDHRTYTIRSNALKRIDKEGEWTNLIQPGEEDVPFYGKSKVGRLAPVSWPSNWLSLSFSAFIRKVKSNGSTEVKFCHVVQGSELSGNFCWDRVNPMNRSVNPQHFNHIHSLENLPEWTEHGLDDTFYLYFRKYLMGSWRVKFYELFIRGLNKIILRITIQPRAVDASGTKRVKRVVLQRDVRNKIVGIYSKIQGILNHYRHYDW